MTSAADAATAAFLVDKTCHRAMPWSSFTPTVVLDESKEYYCVATWGHLGLTAVPAFFRSVGEIWRKLDELPRGQCVGYSKGARYNWPFSAVVETLTIWHTREHARDFFRSGAHREGMATMRGRIEFRAHKVWVKASDLPLPGDSTSTKQFWTAVKGGQFRKVGEEEVENHVPSTSPCEGTSSDPRIGAP